MAPMLDEFARLAGTVPHARPQLPIVSTLTGEPVNAFTPSYWADQIRGTVRFADAITRMRAQKVARFVELGPDANLIGAIDETCGDGALAVALLRRDRPEPAGAVTALARLWADGGRVDWHAFYAHTDARTTDLPTYPFARDRYWMQNPEGATPRATARRAHRRRRPAVRDRLAPGDH
ncbi:hypothetical protein ACWV95_04245 [Streptomyces albus]